MFTGGGRVAAGDRLVLAPAQARSASETHATLAVSRHGFGDLRLRAVVRTVRQLRAGRPNPWEVAWVLWSYTSPRSFYYVALKPNGWEVGKEDPAYPGNQRFLATGERGFPVGAEHRVDLEQSGARLRVAAGGELLVDLVDDERPLPGGAIGLYCEDAEVEIVAVEHLRGRPSS